MTRIFLMAVAFSGLFVVPLLDTAIKGVFVLLVAGLMCLLLRRDSAATRHCVLAVAISMLLLLPILSFLLPEWQMLPGWMVPTASLTNTVSLVSQTQDDLMNPSFTGNSSPQVDQSDIGNLLDIDHSDVRRDEVFPSMDSATVPEQNLPVKEHVPGSLVTQTEGSETVSDGDPIAFVIHTVPVIWGTGVFVLLLRIALSAWRLRRSERRCVSGNAELGEDLAQAQNTIGHTRPVRLLLDPDQSVPIVWGLFKPRLRLPADAVQWPKDQLQSVLLHELCHLRRHDLIELALTQFACSLHWMNPLIWLAAWRLHIERERACDDLVLSSGVRPSAYAGHLLQVAMNVTSPRWTQVCGLAMARKSSLEGRLMAVLSQKINRRGTTVALMLIAILCGASITTPVAMMGALKSSATANGQDERPAAEQPPAIIEPPAATAPAVATAPPPEEERPLHESAQELLSIWQKRARTDGKIPGALIGQLGAKVEDFIRQYPQEQATGKLIEMRGRFDDKRDWTISDLRLLLNEVAEISTAPIGWTTLPMEFDEFRTIRTGQPLPAELLNAPWGVPVENGLRAAWLLEPQADQYALNTVLKVRVLFHNAGNQPVVFRTETWHQSDRLSVRNAENQEIKTSGTFFTGITPLANFRLMPGEYCEVSAPGVAIGAGEYPDEYSTGKLGTIIEANEGDEVSFSCTVDAAEGITFSRPDDPEDPLELWKLQTANRVASEAPLPVSSADREQLIRRVMIDLTGELPTPEEVSQFVSDQSPDALAALTVRIQGKVQTPPWTGKLPTGTTRFRVVAADPKAAKAPRMANSPGRYMLGDSAMLLVRQTTTASGRENKANIAFLSSDPKVASPHKEYSFSLPDGIGAYGIVWERSAGELWVLQRDLARRIVFSDPANVIETRFEPGSLDHIPEHLRETMEQAFLLQGTKVVGSRMNEATESQLDWGDPVNGLRGAVIIRSPASGESEQIFLALQNVSDRQLKFSDVKKSERLRSLYVSDMQDTLFALSSSEPTMITATLQPREVVYLPMMQAVSELGGQRDVTQGLIEGLQKDSLQTWRIILDMSSSVRDGSWTGRLSTGETRGAIREWMPQPTSGPARELFKQWLSYARLNGDIPGGLVQLLHEKVNEYIRNNEPDPAGNPSALKMRTVEPRLVNRNDWKSADIVRLLDDIAAVSSIPLETSLIHLQQHTLNPGVKLPAALEAADWGDPLPSGLRMAYVLAPDSGDYPLGTEVKARIILHNPGSAPITFITSSFQQPRHSAQSADGKSLTIESTRWLTLGRMVGYRLAPGEYCELNTPGLGIGAQVKDRDDWASVRAGSWIDCSEGDEIIVTPGPAELSFRRESQASRDWWVDFITERLSWELPFPADLREREYLLYRVVRELYGAAPSTTEGDAFAADHSPDALRNLAILLAKHPYGMRSEGLIQAGSKKLRVLPVDADVDKRPRVASGPGRYSLSDSIKLSINRRASGNLVRNEAGIIYFQEGKDNVHQKIPLPDGYDTWAIATMKGATELWIAESGVLRKLDFANPVAPAESRFEGDQLNEAPISRELLNQLKGVLEKNTEGIRVNSNGGPGTQSPPEERKRQLAPGLYDLLEEWHKSSSQIGRLEGTHVRRVYNTVSKVESMSHGRIYFESPDKFRIDMVAADITPEMLKSRQQGKVAAMKDQNTGRVFDLKADKNRSWLCDGQRCYDLDLAAKEATIAPMNVSIPGGHRIDSIQRALPFLIGMPTDKVIDRFDLTFSMPLDGDSGYARIKASSAADEGFRWHPDWPAGDLESVEIILNLTNMLPTAIRLVDASGTRITSYTFSDMQVTTSGSLRQILISSQENLFKPDLKDFKVTDIQ